ncbi:MAG: hypothetical protein FWF15_05450 [Oscillospiraceae bacterium]|nr:hypothetical protein [Oscillospiraceae bacterium]
MEKRIVLGSGKLFVILYTGEIPNDTTIETENNRIGAIQGGASLEYSSEFYEAKDDSGVYVKQIMTNEDVLLKSGIMTWNGSTLSKLCQTARVTETAEKRTVKIGGVGNADGKKYLIRFLHEDPIDGDIRVTIVGSSQAGFTIAFAKDKETVIDAEWKAMPHDSEGTLVIYEEEIKAQEEKKDVTGEEG